MERRKGWLTSGAFARLCGTTKETLRHYKNVGLLRPAHQGENGYFYYDAGQFYDFYAVTIFRQTGTPLEEIRRCLEGQDPAGTLALLREQRERLEAELPGSPGFPRSIFWPYRWKTWRPQCPRGPVRRRCSLLFWSGTGPCAASMAWRPATSWEPSTGRRRPPDRGPSPIFTPGSRSQPAVPAAWKNLLETISVSAAGAAGIFPRGTLF